MHPRRETPITGRCLLACATSSSAARRMAAFPSITSPGFISATWSEDAAIFDPLPSILDLRYAPPAMTVYETTNHHTIFHWATSRGLWPACLRGQPDRIRLGGDEFDAENEE